LKKHREAGIKGWEIVSRHDIGQRLAVGRDCFGVAPQKPQQRRKCQHNTNRRSMPCRLGVGEGAVGKPQSLVDSPEPPQCEGVTNFRDGVGIRAEPVDEIAVACLIVEFDGLLTMVMGAGKVAEIPAGGAGSAVRDQGFGAIGPGRGFAQEKLRHFAHRRGFAARIVPDPKTEIGGEPFRGVFHPVCQFAGARKGGPRFRRLMSLGPDQRIAEADLELDAPLAQRGGALHRIAFRERREQDLTLGEFGNCWVGGKPSTAGASTACASASRLAA